MNNKFIIREIHVSEFDSLINIWTKASLPFKPEGRDTKDNIRKQLFIETNRIFVTEINEKLVGALIASHNGRKGWINRLAVLPEFRGKGIANSLIKKAEDFFLSNKIKIFACLIEDWNDQSMKFFQNKDYIEHKEIIYFTKRIDSKI
jgi:ribosomal protein S18 acetylase RimI-like enzyme